MKRSELVAGSIHWVLDDVAGSIDSTFVQLKIQTKSRCNFLKYIRSQKNLKSIKE